MPVISQPITIAVGLPPCTCPSIIEPTTSAISGKSVSWALVGRTACPSISAATVAINPP